MESIKTAPGARLKEKNNAFGFSFACAVCPDPFKVNSTNSIDSTGSINPQTPRLRPF
jgi:hypothetical protein